MFSAEPTTQTLQPEHTIPSNGQALLLELRNAPGDTFHSRSRLSVQLPKTGSCGISDGFALREEEAIHALKYDDEGIATGRSNPWGVGMSRTDRQKFNTNLAVTRDANQPLRAPTSTSRK